MIRFHSIQRHVEKGDPTGQVVLHMYYEDVSDLCHLLWKCRDNGLLETDNEKLLQLEFQNLRHLLADGQTCEPFEICYIHERLEEMGLGDKKQGIDVWHNLEYDSNDLPEDDKKVAVKYKCRGEEVLSFSMYNSSKKVWSQPLGLATDRDGNYYEYKINSWRLVD